MSGRRSGRVATRSRLTGGSSKSRGASRGRPGTRYRRARLNGVRQGLVAALFTGSRTREESFLEEARAGVLKLGAGTAGVDPGSPFGGFKASGVGSAEHGASDREFYTRPQCVVRGPLAAPPP